MSRVISTLCATALAVSTGVYAVNPNSGQTSTSQTLNIEITSPVALSDVDINSTVTVEGRVNIGDVPSSGRSNVAYLLDVSFSTEFSTNDCNNDGNIDDGDNFTPSDSIVGSVLDCEVGAVMALNDSLGSNPSVSAAVVIFGTNAATAQDFISPPDSDPDGDGLSAIDATLIQLNQAGGPISVGGLTDFESALTEVTRLMNTRPSDEQRVAYFLTDGQDSSSITTAANAARDAGIRIETFSIGDGASPCDGSSLSEIASITGGMCTDVQDINTLTAVISNTSGVPPTGISEVSVSLNGDASEVVAVDNLGNWSTTIDAANLADGANVLEATVTADDGTAVIADLTFNAIDPTVTPDPDIPDTDTDMDMDMDMDIADSDNGDADTPDSDNTTSIPNCASAASDPDGDGWGFENGKSCLVAAGMTTGMMGPMYCIYGSASDYDGDGWGWENNASCLVEGSAFDLARIMLPHCANGAASDNDGDGWGWENNTTCVVPGSPASMLID